MSADEIVLIKNFQVSKLLHSAGQIEKFKTVQFPKKFFRRYFVGKIICFPRVYNVPGMIFYGFQNISLNVRLGRGSSLDLPMAHLITNSGKGQRIIIFSEARNAHLTSFLLLLMYI